MDLDEFLSNWTREFRRCGACIQRVDFGTWSGAPEAIEFRLYVPSRGIRAASSPPILRVEAWRVEDWALRPCHTLLEGTLEIQLVTEDPILTRQHLESLDCEGYRTEFPERVVMLRHGETYVVAEGFDARWVHAEDNVRRAIAPTDEARP